MRNRTTIKPGCLVLLGVMVMSFHVLAQQDQSVERVLFKGGKMLVEQSGKASPMDKEVALPNEIKVMTNATFRVKSGRERKLDEGQILGADGMLTSPDGSIVPVIDHVTMKNGQILLAKDGDTSTLQIELRLEDGSKVTPDGYLVSKYGVRVKLMDGQMLRMDGQLIPAKDTVTLSGGKVRVQKDGSQFEVAAGRSLTMNDGAKIFGDGTVLMKDGTTKKLVEGEILVLEGVVRK